MIALVVAFLGAAAAEAPARVVDVPLDRSVTVSLVGVTQAVVVDEAICRADTAPGAVRISGMRRGETIVIVWQGEERSTLLVRVSAPAPAHGGGHATPAELDAVGRGTIGSLAHIGITSRGGGRSISLLTPFAWTEGAATNRFAMNGQVQGAKANDASAFALDTVSAQWIRGAATVQLFDVAVNLDGGAGAQITPAPATTSVTLRGADIMVSAGRTSYEAFVGTTLPWFAASRQIGGLAVSRQVNDRMRIDGTTAAVRAPILAKGTTVGYEGSVFQTLGITDRVSDRTAVQIRGGVGTSGVYAQGAASHQGDRIAAYLNASASSPQFGANQLQLVYAPNVVVQGSATASLASRLRAGAAYNHTTTQATPLFPAAAVADYFSETLSFTVTRDHILFANATSNRSIGGLGIVGEQTGRRFDAGLSSQFGRRASNHLQVSSGALADPLQINSRSEFTAREDLTFALRGGSLNIGFSHNRLSPSLVSRLRQQLNLLAPGLQPLFMDDPVGFVQSPQMPADVLRVLDALEAVDTQASVSGMFRLGSRLTLNPTFAYLHHAQTTTLATRNEMLGYSLTWRAARTLELQSTLANALIFDPRQVDLARTTIFGVGVRKTFTGAPRWIAPTAGYQIRGRVFRDLNLDGTASADEPGLPGVVVRLSDGRIARTNDRGAFEFRALSPGEYRLLLPLDQLGPGARVTTAIDPVVRLYERRAADVDFGVVNFARILGTVFNDLALTGVREAGAPGLRAVAISIDGGGVERRVVTDAAGDFEIDDLAPGRYRLSIDPASLPANYEPRGSRIDVDVAPSSTASVSLPVRALRSISGRVFWRAAGAAPAPLRGITVSAQAATAVTDADGRFLLRDLPAGDLTVEVVPALPLPDGLAAPAGRLRMPAQPMQIEGATIVIENPRLIPYLTTTAAPSQAARKDR